MQTQAESEARYERYKNAAVGVKEKVESEYSQFIIESGFRDAELYTNKFGYHAAFPMDTLHTVPKGIADLLLSILNAHIGGIKAKNKKKRKRGEKKKKSALSRNRRGNNNAYFRHIYMRRIF